MTEKGKKQQLGRGGGGHGDKIERKKGEWKLEKVKLDVKTEINCRRIDESPRRAIQRKTERTLKK